MGKGEYDDKKEAGDIELKRVEDEPQKWDMARR